MPPRPLMMASVRRLPHLAQRNSRSFQRAVALAGVYDGLQVRWSLVMAGLAPYQQAQIVGP